MSTNQSEKPYYLAGPMSNIPQFNFPAFYAATAALRAAGFGIVSPAELDDQEDKGLALKSATGAPGDHPNKTWGDFLARDVKIVSDQVQGIIFLPNWHLSKGAKLEAFVALLCKHKFGVYMEGCDPLVTWVPPSFVLATIATNMQVAA
jgi:hypothetical protein